MWRYFNDAYLAALIVMPDFVRFYAMKVRLLSLLQKKIDSRATVSRTIKSIKKKILRRDQLFTTIRFSIKTALRMRDELQTDHDFINLFHFSSPFLSDHPGLLILSCLRGLPRSGSLSGIHASFVFFTCFFKMLMTFFSPDRGVSRYP
jgi:hypothetical protein